MSIEQPQSDKPDKYPAGATHVDAETAEPNERSPIPRIPRHRPSIFDAFFGNLHTGVRP